MRCGLRCSCGCGHCQPCDSPSTPPTWRPCGRLAQPRAAAAEANFDAVLAERRPTEHNEPAIARGGGLLVETGVEDAEHSASATTQHLQHRLAAVVMTSASPNCRNGSRPRTVQRRGMTRAASPTCAMRPRPMSGCGSSTRGPRATLSRTPSSTR